MIFVFVLFLLVLFRFFLIFYVFFIFTLFMYLLYLFSYICYLFVYLLYLFVYLIYLIYYFTYLFYLLYLCTLLYSLFVHVYVYVYVFFFFFFCCSTLFRVFFCICLRQENNPLKIKLLSVLPKHQHMESLLNTGFVELDVNRLKNFNDSPKIENGNFKLNSTPKIDFSQAEIQ
jgi:hypothetical protein